MKKLLIILALLLPTGVFAQVPQQPQLETLLKDYTTALFQGKFAQASEYMDPQDLKTLHRVVLDFLKELSAYSDPQAQELLTMFRGDFQGPIADMTPVQVFTSIVGLGLSRVPPEELAKATVNILGYRTTENPEIFFVDMKLNLMGVTVDSSERLRFSQDKWTIRSKEDPETLEAKFSTILQGLKK